MASTTRSLNAWGPRATTQRPLNAWGPSTITPGYTAPKIASPSATVAQAAAAAPGAGPAAPAAPNVRDSTFNSGVAGLLARNKQGRDDLTAQGVAAGQDFNTMLARMADNRAQSLLAQNYGANKQGLFYSGQLGKRRDETNKGYDQQQQDSQTSYDRANAARAQALDRLGEFSVDEGAPAGVVGTGQAGVDLSDLFNQAIVRQATANANGGGDLAALAGGVTPAQALAAPPAAAPESIPHATASSSQGGSGTSVKIAASKAHGGAKWVYHRAASGEWIPVRPA